MNELDLTALQSRQEAELRFESRVNELSMRKFLATNLDRTPEGSWRWIVNLPALTAALPTLEQTSLGPDDSYVGEVLFIGGGKSPYIQTRDEDLIRLHFPRARIERILDSGHNPHIEKRDEFVRLVLSAS